VSESSYSSRYRPAAERHDLAVGQRVVLEVHAGALGQVRGGAGPPHQLGQAREVVGLHVRLVHGDDRDVLRRRQRDVVVDEVGVRIDDREAPLRLAALQVGRTTGSRR
jgi:hypothetical protein